MQVAQHPLDTALELDAVGGDEWRAHTNPAYANYIGPYGGITAAQAMHAVMQHPARLGEPVSFTINYAAAIADGAFTIVAKPVRTNRSTQHWTVEIVQGGALMATATALTAARRETWGSHEAKMPQVPRPQDVPRTPRRGIEWINRYAMHIFEGGIPQEWEGQGAASSLTRMWVRDDPPRPLDFASLTALADVFFPRIWLRRATQTPLGTVTMTVYYHADAAQLAATGTGWLLGQANGNGLRNGYHDQAGLLWNEAGELLATTHQLMYFKE